MNRLLAASPWQVFLAMFALTAGALAVVVLFLFDPASHGFYPQCPFHAATGLWCPGCGSLRAVHQLTRGHFAEAWRLNPFFVSLLPVALWLGVREALRMATGTTLPGLVTRPIFGWLAVAGLVLFGIFRNIPLPH